MTSPSVSNDARLDLAAFARLQAELSKPFARREELLRAASLDEPGLARAQRHWKEALAAPDANALRERFCAAWRGDLEAPAPPASTTMSAVDEPATAREPAAREPTPPVARVLPSYLQAPPTVEATDVDATQPPIRRGEPTLPFLRGVAGEVPAAVQAQKGAAQREPPPPGDGDETAFLPPAALRTALELPFGKATQGDGRGASADGGPWITLEAYAEFLAAYRTASPSDAAALRRRFGVGSDDDQRALGAAFAARFARDPRERAAFDALLARRRGENR